MLKLPSINPTLYRAAVTSSFRLSSRKFYTLNTKFYILSAVQFHPNPVNTHSTEKHNTYQFVVVVVVCVFIYIYIYIYSTRHDDGLQICPKYVEVDCRNKLRINNVTSWFSLHRLNTKFRPHSIFFNSYVLLNKAPPPPPPPLKK